MGREEGRGEPCGDKGAFIPALKGELRGPGEGGTSGGGRGKRSVCNEHLKLPGVIGRGRERKRKVCRGNQPFHELISLVVVVVVLERKTSRVKLRSDKRARF